MAKADAEKGSGATTPSSVASRALPRVEWSPVKTLTPAPWNPRVISEERFANLQRSIADDPDYFALRPILVTKKGTVYAGNMRLRAAIALGWPDVPTIRTDIDEPLAKRRAIRDNEQWGSWDADPLAELVSTLKLDGVDVTLLGLDEKELASLLEQTGANGDTEFPEADPNAMEFAAKCPRCSFEFDPGAK